MELIKFLEPYKNGREMEALEILNKEFLIKNRIMNGKVLLKYHRQADKALKIVRECRGTILSLDGFKVVSLPLEKFGNHGESYAPTDIDITKSKILEKADGTCCSLYWDQINGKWCVQTLAQPEAQETAKGFTTEGRHTFKWYELFWNTFALYSDIDLLEKLDKDWTYVFELCTPWNKVIIRYDKPTLYFLAMRNKKTFLEDWPEKSVLYGIFEKPKTYDYGSIDEIIKIAKEKLTKDEEGFILIDENFRRIKIKSAEYVKIHYENTVITLNGVIAVVFQNEQEEWLSSLPEYKEVIDAIIAEVKVVGKKIDDYCELCFSQMKDKSDRKELAFIVKSTPGFRLGRHYVFKIWSGELKSGIECVVNFERKEELSKKVSQFIDESEICKKIEFNRYNASLRG
jgi:hypothetical protein